MAADLFSEASDFGFKYSNSPTLTVRLSKAITPSDTMDVTNPAGDNAPNYAKYLWVGSGGNLNVIEAGDQSNGGAGTPALYTAVPIGWFPVQVRRVMATSTTAGFLRGIYA
jgi:hypothetical protein